MALEKRYKIAFAMRAAEQCNCHFAGETTYHTAADLESILRMRCSIHGMRFHRSITWAPVDAPLDPSDQGCCSCPPDMWRNYRLGKREHPTPEEQAKYLEGYWEKLALAVTPEGGRSLIQEIASADQLIKAYEKARGEAHGRKI